MRTTLAILLAASATCLATARLGEAAADLPYWGSVEGRTELQRLAGHVASTGQAVTPPHRCAPALSAGVHVTSTVNLNDPDAAAEWQAATAGVQANTCAFGLPWSELEPVPGLYNMTLFTQTLRWYASKGMRCAVSVLAVSGGHVTVPPDLADPVDPHSLRPGLAWNDSQVMDRYALLASNVAPIINEYDAFYWGVGSEVDTAISDADIGLEFATFVIVAREVLLNVTSASFSVGASFTTLGFYEQMSKTGGPDAWVSVLASLTDITPLTYYRFAPGSFDVADPSVPLVDFPGMVDLMSPFGGCVALEAFGYPSGYGNAQSVDNSTQAKQADFYKNVITAVTEQKDSFRFMQLVGWTDMDLVTCQALAKTYGDLGPAFAEFMCTLGVYNADNTPKQAASVVPELLRLNPAA